MKRIFENQTVLARLSVVAIFLCGTVSKADTGLRLVDRLESLFKTAKKPDSAYLLSDRLLAGKFQELTHTSEKVTGIGLMVYRGEERPRLVLEAVTSEAYFSQLSVAHALQAHDRYFGKIIHFTPDDPGSALSSEAFAWHVNLPRVSLTYLLKLIPSTESAGIEGNYILKLVCAYPEGCESDHTGFRYLNGAVIGYGYLSKDVLRP